MLYLIRTATNPNVRQGFESVDKARVYAANVGATPCQIVPYDGHPSMPNFVTAEGSVVDVPEMPKPAPHVPDGFDAWIEAGGTKD